MNKILTKKFNALVILMIIVLIKDKLKLKVVTIATKAQANEIFISSVSQQKIITESTARNK